MLPVSRHQRHHFSATCRGAPSCVLNRQTTRTTKTTPPLATHTTKHDTDSRPLEPQRGGARENVLRERCLLCRLWHGVFCVVCVVYALRIEGRRHSPVSDMPDNTDTPCAEGGPLPFVPHGTELGPVVGRWAVGAGGWAKPAHFAPYGAVDGPVLALGGRWACQGRANAPCRCRTGGEKDLWRPAEGTKTAHCAPIWPSRGGGREQTGGRAGTKQAEPPHPKTQHCAPTPSLTARR